MDASNPERDPPADLDVSTSPRMRMVYLTIGWICVGLGAAGMIFPVVPGVPFLIVALWAFSRSSRRFHDWLLNHRFFGPPVRRWQEGHVIPLPIKVIAIAAMAASFSYLALGTATPWYVLTAVATIMLMGTAYILKCPSLRPRPEKARAGGPARRRL